MQFDGWMNLFGTNALCEVGNIKTQNWHVHDVMAGDRSRSPTVLMKE